MSVKFWFTAADRIVVLGTNVLTMLKVPDPLKGMARTPLVFHEQITDYLGPSQGDFFMKCHHCERDAIGRGLCRRHYQQAWKAKALDQYLTENGGPHTLKRRLLSKYRVTPNGCWEWTGHRKKDVFDYGLIWVDGRMRRTHRVSYELHKGPIPEGLDVLHSCDNPPCINPDHLSVGTRGENVEDAASRNRFPLDEAHHATKLTADQVIEIRSNRSSFTNLELALIYGVNPSTISRIRSGERRAKT